MHPDRVIHLNQEYALGHLAQHIGQFRWTGSDDNILSFKVRVRYSPHCYSEEGIPPYPEGSWIFIDNNKDRIFCPDRHAYSFTIPVFIKGLLETPTMPVSLSYEKSNLFVCRPAMTPPLRPNHKYFIFFHVKSQHSKARDDRSMGLDLYVESAYQRSQAVRFRSRFPFGTIAERTAKGVRI
jgi:hypothetical protein